MRHPALSALCLLGLLALFAIGCSDGGNSPLAGNQVSLTLLNTDTLNNYTPLWVAFQDGVAGDWTHLTGSGVYTAAVTDPAGAYGFAVAMNNGGGVQVIYLRATLADATALTLPVEIYAESVRNPRDRIASRRTARARITTDNTWTMRARIMNIPSGFDALSMGCPLDSGTSTSVTYTSTETDFDFPADRPGDVCALLSDATENGLLFLQRDLSNPAGAYIEEDIDFSTPYGGDKLTYEVPDRSTVTVDGANYMEAGWLTANGTYLLLQDSSSDSITYPVIPAAAATENDRYLFYAGASSDGYANVFYWSQAPAASFSLPDAFSCDFSGDTFTGLDHSGASLYGLSTGNNDTYWYGMVTQAWLTAAGATSVTLPDFSTADGWQSAWGFSSPIAWVYVDEIEHNATLQAYLLHEANLNFLQPVFPDGTFIREIEYQAYPMN